MAAYHEVVSCHGPSLSQEAARPARARHPHLRPLPSEARYRVVATDPVSGERIFVKCRTEDAARAKTCELEQFIAQAAPILDPQDAGPRSVERLAGRYIEDHLSGLSLRVREKQTYLLGRWVLPRIGARTVTAWTPADSAAVIAAVRRAGGSDALVQDIGAVMRALVTHARRLRWLNRPGGRPGSGHPRGGPLGDPHKTDEVRRRQAATGINDQDQGGVEPP